MVDLTKLQLISDPLLLNAALAGCLVLITFLLLYIVTLRRKMTELKVACATDEKLRSVLKSTDELLGKLSDTEIESFVSSPQFEVYKEVVKPIIEEQKKTQSPPPTAPEKKESSPGKVAPPIPKGVEPPKEQKESPVKLQIPKIEPPKQQKMDSRKKAPVKITVKKKAPALKKKQKR